MDEDPSRNAPTTTGPTLCQPGATVDKNFFPTRFVPSGMIPYVPQMNFGNRMLSALPSESEDEKFTETCKRHAKEFIKYHCPHHEVLLCRNCIVDEGHGSCNFERISQVSKQFKESAEYKNLKRGLGKMKNDIAKSTSYIQANMNAVDEESLANIDELHKFRNEINQYLDKREKEFLVEIDQKKHKSKTLLNRLKSKCTNITLATEKIKSELNQQDSNSNQFFIVGKRSIKDLAGLRTALKDVDRSRDVPRHKFKRDSTTEQLLASKTALGRLKEDESTTAAGKRQLKQGKTQQTRQLVTHLERPKHAQATTQQDGLSDEDDLAAPSSKRPRCGYFLTSHPKQMLKNTESTTQVQAKSNSNEDLSKAKFIRQSDIPVKTLANTSDCWLSSVVLLSEDRLLLTDAGNTSVKLVDTQTNMVVSEVKLSCKPWGVCLLPGDRAAITMSSLFSKGRIQILSTQEKLSLQDIIYLDGDHHGIGFCEGNLIVSFVSPAKVVMIDMKGNVKKSVDKDSSGKPLFERPGFLTMTREGLSPVIYVSDSSTYIITKLNSSLQVIQTWNNNKLGLINPQGLTPVIDNQILVCGGYGNIIVSLDMSNNKMTKLLGKVDGIEAPFSVAYHPQQKRIFVTSFKLESKFNNSIKVYNVL